MQMSMVQMARQQLHQILPLVSMRDEDIQRYVVSRRVQPPASVVSSCPGMESSPQSSDSYETASGSAEVMEEATVDVKLRSTSEVGCWIVLFWLMK